jgi:xylose dehydrogenase (NAD/NADP)
VTTGDRSLTVPRVHAGDPAPKGTPPVRWGVLGATSTVARRSVVPALEASPRAEVVATASRSQGERYEAVLDDDAVEAVYLPLPTALHGEWTQRAAAAGKHVLCEKPLGRTAEEAAAMASACEAAGVWLLEAHRTPFHPRATAVEDVVRAGGLGDLRFAHAVFTAPRGDPSRRRPDLGGGVLLDHGVDCLDPLLSAAAGLPHEVRGRAVGSPSGVEASFTGLLGFASGFTATFECSFEVPARQALELVGTEGALRVPRAFTPGVDDATFERVGLDGSTEVVESRGGDASRGMVDHFCALVRSGTIIRRPPSVSVALLSVLDRLREAAA